MADDNLSDYVVRHLVEHIRQNSLQSGAVVPSELRVASELQVSRGIVREAYRSLKMAGILDVSNGRAPRVGHLNNNYFCQTVNHALSTRQVWWSRCSNSEAPSRFVRLRSPRPGERKRRSLR